MLLYNITYITYPITSLDYDYMPYLNIPVELFIPPPYLPTNIFPQSHHFQMFINIRHVPPQVGLLLMVRIVDFYRKRMQQRKARDARTVVAADVTICYNT